MGHGATMRGLHDERGRLEWTRVRSMRRLGRLVRSSDAPVPHPPARAPPSTHAVDSGACAETVVATRAPPSTAQPLCGRPRGMCGDRGYCGGPSPSAAQPPYGRQRGMCGDRGCSEDSRRRRPSDCAVDRGACVETVVTAGGPRRRRPSLHTVDSGACVETVVTAGGPRRRRPSLHTVDSGACVETAVAARTPAVDGPASVRSTAGHVWRPWLLRGALAVGGPASIRSTAGHVWRPRLQRGLPPSTAQPLCGRPRGMCGERGCCEDPRRRRPSDCAVDRGACVETVVAARTPAVDGPATVRSTAGHVWRPWLLRGPPCAETAVAARTPAVDGPASVRSTAETVVAACAVDRGACVRACVPSTCAGDGPACRSRNRPNMSDRIAPTLPLEPFVPARSSRGWVVGLLRAAWVARFVRWSRLAPVKGR